MIKEKGITLIALVITIIVLLILAGVSIVTLTGQNGLLTRASNVVDKSKEAEEKEQIGLAYNGVMAENKGIGVTQSQLQTELQKYDSKAKVEETEDGYKITFSSGNVYTIKKDGTIEKLADPGDETEGTPATAEEVNAKIGQVVSDYTEDSGKVDDWRIFYASDTEMFLISSNTISSSDAFGSNSGIPLKQKVTNRLYSGATDEVFNDGNYGATYNSMWKATKSTDDKERSKATAYLCDSNNWTEYLGNNATYAVGGPTKELFIKSWNASIPQTNVQEVLLANEDVTKDGYAKGKPSHLYDDKPILKTILPKTENGEDGLYNNGYIYWLASPSSSYTFHVCDVHYGKCLSSNGYNLDATLIGVRPLVSIPISNVQINNGIVKIVNN